MPSPLECILSLAVTFSFLLGISFLFNVAYVIKRSYSEPKNKKEQNNTRVKKTEKPSPTPTNKSYVYKQSNQKNSSFTRKKPQIALKETVRSPEELSRYLKN